MNTPSEVHYVVVGRRSAYKKSQVEMLLRGRPEFQVVIDRRQGERRTNNVSATGANLRTGSDRRF